MDLIDQCHKVWQCRSMEIELAEASAKLVEQQAEIERLRAALRDVLSYVPHGDMPVTIYDNARATLEGK